MRGLTYWQHGGKGQAQSLPRLHHVTVELAPKEVDPTIHFYKTVLCLNPIKSMVRNSAWFEQGVHLYWGMRETPHYGPIPAGHFALVLGRAYDAIRIACQKERLFITDGSVYWGSKRCYVQDPAGNRIELMEFAPNG